MKITNKHHLPEPMVLAVQGERYYTDGRMGVTNLIMPPRIYQLQKRHDAEIVDDAIDRIWLIFGTAIHKILEGAWRYLEEMPMEEKKRLFDLAFQLLKAGFDPEEEIFPLVSDKLSLEGAVLLDSFITDLLEEPFLPDKIIEYPPDIIEWFEKPGIILSEKYLVEQKFTIDMDGYTVVCKGDIYDVQRQILSDYKVTSVWKVINEVDPDWVAQLNANNFIYKAHDILSTKLQVVGLLRDWSRGKSMQGGNYPPTQVKRVNIPIWGDNTTEAWIRDRVREHDEASTLPDDKLPECTAKERFRDPDKWAARKKSNKKATKLFLREEEANDWKDAQKDGDQFMIEYRPGEDKRCNLYCSAAPFCNQFQQSKRGQDEQNQE